VNERLQVVVGQRIRSRRKELGMSLNKLAAQIGMSTYNAISRWESGKTLPSMDSIIHLLQALNWTPNEFFKDLK
jgi:transcriptional regulator with XRE-family HTH domain